MRLFLTCWLVYALHFASNTVREIYLALSIGDHMSFRVDEYANLHPDLFETPGYGWHIANNPGASMAAAVPYALFRPVTDRIVKSVNQKRAAAGQTEPPVYASPYPMAQDFYRDAWKRGFDIKFGLAAFVIQLLCMAPSSALGVVVMFYVLRHMFRSDRTALWLALLYAFGTPVFFRTGFLNHNLMLGHIAFMGFAVMWNPGGNDNISVKTRSYLGGLAGGTALLFDYSGVVALLGLFGYCLVRHYRGAARHEALRQGTWYVLGTLAPVFLLWFYQYKSFGHPLYPAQHWMPASVRWSDLGYSGFGWPQFELFTALAFDYRYGFFLASPLMLLALASPLANRGENTFLPARELWFLLLLFMAFWLFFSGTNYTRLQFNTGIRYLMSAFPFLFLPAVTVLVRLPRFVMYFLALVCVTESWCLAMYRDVETGYGLLEPIVRVFSEGFQLPIFTVLSRMGDQYGGYFSNGGSPLPLFVFTAFVIYGVWNLDYRLDSSVDFGGERNERG